MYTLIPFDWYRRFNCYHFLCNPQVVRRRLRKTSQFVERTMTACDQDANAVSIAISSLTTNFKLFFNSDNPLDLTPNHNNIIFQLIIQDVIVKIWYNNIGIYIVP